MAEDRLQDPQIGVVR